MGEQRTKLEEAVDYMVRGLVMQHSEVDVEQVDGIRGPIVHVRVAQQDFGRLLGRQGRNVQAMRALLAAGAVAMGEGVGKIPNIEVEEP